MLDFDDKCIFALLFGVGISGFPLLYFSQDKNIVGYYLCLFILFFLSLVYVKTNYLKDKQHKFIIHLITYNRYNLGVI